MKCPNCGQDNKGKICKYCHTELPFSERMVSLKIFLVDLRYIINCIFLPSAKVTFIIYTNLCFEFASLFIANTYLKC